MKRVLSKPSSSTKTAPRKLLGSASAKSIDTNLVGVPQVPPLLYSRRQTARLFADSSVATIIRLEKDGRLKPVKLSRKPTAMTFYYAADVHALVDGLSSKR